MPSSTNPPEFRLHYHSVWWAIGVCLFLLLLYGSLAPAAVMPPVGSNDKIAHSFAYFSVMIWFAQMFAPLRTRCAVALVLIAMGIAIEFIQPYVNRHFDWYDALANAEGVAVGLILSLTPLRRTLAYIDQQLRQRAS